MNSFQLFLAEGVMGYLLQCSAYVIGICALSKKRVNLLPLIISCLMFTGATFVIRFIGRFNFGIHTMLTMLIANVLCVCLLKVDIRSSILGSLVVMILVLAGEVMDYGLLMCLFTQDEIAVRMTDRLFKAWAAVPGNLVLLAIVITLYLLKAHPKKLEGSDQNAKTGL